MHETSTSHHLTDPFPVHLVQQALPAASGHLLLLLLPLLLPPGGGGPLPRRRRHRLQVGVERAGRSVGRQQGAVVGKESVAHLCGRQLPLGRRGTPVEEGGVRDLEEHLLALDAHQRLLTHREGKSVQVLGVRTHLPKMISF